MHHYHARQVRCRIIGQLSSDELRATGVYRAISIGRTGRMAHSYRKESFHQVQSLELELIPSPRLSVVLQQLLSGEPSLLHTTTTRRYQTVPTLTLGPPSASYNANLSH